MSLQVWLPLTKDLSQQGLSNVEATNSGATYSSTGGKLGGCYNFTNNYCAVNVSLSTTVSIACWTKTSTNGKMSWVLEDDAYGYLNLYEQDIYTLNAGDSNNNPFKTSTNTNISCLHDGQWHHFVVTFGNNIAKLYIDGEYQGTAKTFRNPTTTNKRIKIGGFYKNAHSYSWNGAINDFRVYDHCLSPMEVKQISQGLVLHYPLNREGFGQDNLMPNSTIMSVGSANASTGSWRVAGSSQMTRSRVAISDSPIGDVYGCQSVGLQTGQDASCWGIDSFPRENGTTYTISAWGRIVGGSSTAAMLGFSVYSGTTLDYGGTYGQAKSSDTKYYGSGAYDYAGGQLNPNGSWTRIYRTFTSTSASDNIYVGFNTAKTGNSVTLQLCGIKLEKGDKVTSWCPKSTDDLADVIGLNDTTEYDTSGFGNNGTKNNVPTYSSDTAKYQVSTHLNGTNQTIQVPNLSTLIHDDIYTFNIWFKRLESEPSSKAWETIFGGPSGFEIETCSANNVHDNKIKAYSWGSGAFEFEFDRWNMLTLVRTASDSKFYLNGELKLTGTRGSIPSGNYFIGSWSSTTQQNYKGYVSDFRIYTTALSADDVRALYENSAYIDNSGNAYAATYTEV